MHNFDLILKLILIVFTFLVISLLIFFLVYTIKIYRSQRKKYHEGILQQQSYDVQDRWSRQINSYIETFPRQINSYIETFSTPLPSRLQFTNDGLCSIGNVENNQEHIIKNNNQEQNIIKNKKLKTIIKDIK